MSSRQAQPYPHDVWLNVNLDGVPAERRQRTTAQLQQIDGWSTSLTGNDGGALRYEYKSGRETTIPQRARRIVQRAGGRASGVTSFVVWHLEYTFRQVLDVGVFAPMTAAIRELDGVLDTHGRLGDPMLGGMYIEFRGEPKAQVLARVRELVAPHL